jgi:hypothetical protein
LLLLYIVAWQMDFSFHTLRYNSVRCASCYFLCILCKCKKKEGKLFTFIIHWPLWCMRMRIRMFFCFALDNLRRTRDVTFPPPLPPTTYMMNIIRSEIRLTFVHRSFVFRRQQSRFCIHPSAAFIYKFLLSLCKTRLLCMHIHLSFVSRYIPISWPFYTKNVSTIVIQQSSADREFFFVEIGHTIN